MYSHPHSVLNVRLAGIIQATRDFAEEAAQLSAALRVKEQEARLTGAA